MVCVGWWKSLVVICSSIVVLLGGCGGLGFRVSVASHIQPKCNFDHFMLSCASETVNNVWTTIWVGVVSELWKHRNNIIFNRGVGDASEVFSLVQVKVWLWVSFNCRSASFPFSDWCLEPLVCMRLIS